MTREEAISLIQQPCYLNEEDEKKDKKNFSKKNGMVRRKSKKIY